MAKGIPLMGRGPDGKAKMINVDENGNVKVQQSGQIGEQSHISSASNMEIPPGPPAIKLVENGNPSIIDSLEVSVPMWGQTRLLLVKFGTSPLLDNNRLAITVGGGGRLSPSIGDVSRHGSHYFEIREYDTDKREYSMGLKPGVSIYMPEGFALHVQNSNSEARSLSYVMTYRSMG